MNRRMKFFAIFLILTPDIHADTLVLKTGQTLIGKSFRREGDVFYLATGPNGEPVTSETAIP